MWILQIDDDADDLEIFSTAVRLFDPSIVYSGVSSLTAALSLFDTDGCAIPDMMFLDINMPLHSGFDCYAKFKKDARFINTQFTFLSTFINEKEMPAGSAFMKKQHSLKDYVEMLRKHLSSPPSSTSSDMGDSRQYQPCLSIYDIIRLRLQLSASQSSTRNELSTLQLI